MRERDKFMAEAEFKVNHQLTIDTDWWRERGHQYTTDNDRWRERPRDRLSSSRFKQAMPIPVYF